MPFVQFNNTVNKINIVLTMYNILSYNMGESFLKKRLGENCSFHCLNIIGFKLVGVDNNHLPI